MVELDEFDKRMLRILLQDGRISLGALAKKAHISVPRAHYRLQRLIENRAILGFFPVIDFSKLGYTAFRLMIQFYTPEIEKQKSFVEFLSSHPNALWTAECGGRWDVLVDFLEQDIHAFYSLLSEIGQKFGTLDLSYDFLVIQQLYDWSVRFEAEQKSVARQEEKGILSGQKTETDEKDFQILQQLVENGRATVNEIAARTGIHPKTIQSRLQSLKKSNVLLTVVPQVNVERFGLETFKLLLSMRNDFKPKTRLVQHLALKPQTRGVLELAGPWNIEVEINVQNAKEAKEFLLELRKIFPNEIKDFELLPITKEYKYRFIPLKPLDRSPL